MYVVFSPLGMTMSFLAPPSLCGTTSEPFLLAGTTSISGALGRGTVELPFANKFVIAEFWGFVGMSDVWPSSLPARHKYFDPVDVDSDIDDGDVKDSFSVFDDSSQW